MESETLTTPTTPNDAEAIPLGIFAEYELTKTALETAKGRLKTTLEENARLLEEREAAEKDSYAVTEVLRRDLRAQIAETQSLHSLNSQIRSECRAEIVKVKDSASDEIRRHAKEQSAKETRLNERVCDLEKELRQVEEFRQRQKEMEQVVFTFQEEKRALEKNSANEKKATEDAFFEETRRLKLEHADALEQQRIATENEYDKCLDEHVRQILRQNRRMAVELTFHKEETAALQREVRQLQLERLRLSEEVEFRQDLESGYAKRVANQGKLLKEARARASTLEQSLRQLLANCSKQKEASGREHARQLEDAVLEVAGLKRLVIATRRENGSLRTLAQEVLTQRNDVEKFLLSSLHIVRKEIAGSKRECGHEQEGRASLCVAIEDMSWPDRERVLKILLSKMNKTKDASALPEKEVLAGQLSKEGPANPT